MLATTYIFGAGASVHAGYPLASMMGEAFLGWFRAQPNTDPSPYERYFVGQNFEEALNAMSQLLKKNNLSPEEIVDKIAFAYFRNRVREWFLEIGTQGATAYRRFAAEIAKPTDNFISFNYDTCLEQALHKAGIWEISGGYGFGIPGFEQGSTTTVIKLHGSVNWTIRVGNGSPDRPVIVRVDCAELGYPDSFDKSIQAPFAGAGPLLAVPTSEKKFHVDTSFGPRFERFWNDIWMLAGDRLRSSDHVVICGYSLPSADKRAREMLFSLIDKSTNIEIVCGSSGPVIAEQFSKRGFANVVAAKANRFEEWVASRLAH